MAYVLHDLLQRSAARHPDRPAVVMGSTTVSYRELEEQSNRLAHALIAQGCRRGDRVAFYMNKAPASFVAIHGILKAGCAYVPLDPRAPTPRLAYILRDCGVRCLVTAADKLAHLERLVGEGAELESVVLAGPARELPSLGATGVISWEEVGRQPASPPEVPVIETDLAYILYTSGSTGMPKGVMITHLNSLTFVRWAVEELGVRGDDRVSSHAPLHFDLSIFDIFATLMAGGTILPVPSGVSTFPMRQAKWIVENEISVWYSVPSALSMMLLQGKAEELEFPKLRMVLFAGEVFPVKYLRSWLALAPHAGVFNLYGPTETNVITFHRVEHLDPQQTRPVPIGRACANMEVFPVDGEGRIVSEPGVEGELVARGSTVAQGYWGDEEKTARVFVPNFRDPHLKDRLYRTGDIVTLDGDGNLIYVGRRDSMIKSRGYRIELGEIESALYGNAQVKEAAVVARPDDVIGNRIIAFVVAGADARPGAAELETALADALPKYMIPEEILFRDELPKTSTGKIDRRALLESLSHDEAAEARPTEPR